MSILQSRSRLTLLVAVIDEYSEYWTQRLIEGISYRAPYYGELLVIMNPARRYENITGSTVINRALLSCGIFQGGSFLYALEFGAVSAFQQEVTDQLAVR